MCAALTCYFQAVLTLNLFQHSYLYVFISRHYCFLGIGNQPGFTLPFTNIVVNVLAVNHDDLVILGLRMEDGRRSCP